MSAPVKPVAIRSHYLDEGFPMASTSPATPSTSTEQLLQERGERYGPFPGHATVTQRLKQVIAQELRARGKTLEPDQQESLDMICHKIGRIVNGDPNYDDSWVDIAGYAELVVKRLRGHPV